MTEPEPQPARRIAALPSFRQPSPNPTPQDLALDPTATASPPPWLSDDDDSPAVLRDLPIPKPARSDTPTAISATSDVDPKLLAGLVGAVVGIGITIAGVLVKRARPGREIRRPTDRHVKAFAEPAAAILLRHVEIVKLHPSLVDAVKAAGAVGDHIEAGPLTQPSARTAADAGIPNDLPREMP